MYFRITKNLYLPESNIKLFATYDGSAIKKLITKLKEEEKVLDLSGNKKAVSVILLKTGEAILLPLSVDTLNNRMAVKK